MVFAVIVQARMGSTRLPGKVLQPLGARSALLRCLDRCAAIPGVDAVVCAVPQGAQDEPVAQEAAAAGYVVARGPEQDVLARYAEAARQVRAGLVMRVTSDCPFIDPAVCGAVRDDLLETGADYACNNMPPLFPHGLDCDVFPAARLYEAEHAATNAYDREHVTPWLRRADGLRRVTLNGPGQGVERLRWTLDHREDLAFCQGVFEACGEAAAAMPWTELAALCAQRPDLTALNTLHIDEARLQAGRPDAVATASGAAGDARDTDRTEAA